MLGDGNLECTAPTESAMLFPQEIMEQFIDHLEYDSTTLMTSALVCRAWVARSRYHLFPRLAFSRPRTPDCRNLTLLDILEHPLCTLALPVHELIIIHTGKKYHSRSGDSAQLNWIDLFLPHLDRMVSVRFLSWLLLDDATIGCFREVALKASFFASQITILSIGVRYFESTDWVYFLHSFSSLRWLYLTYHLDVEITDWPRNAAQPFLPAIADVDRFAPPPTLSTIMFDTNEKTGTLPFFKLICQWLLLTQTRVPGIVFHSMALSPDDTFSTTPLAQYLQFLGPSLDRLFLQFMDTSSICMFLFITFFWIYALIVGPARFLDIFDLSLNVKLRGLHLTRIFVFNPNTQLFNDQHSLLPFFLSKIAKENLEDLEIGFGIVPASVSDNEPLLLDSWTCADPTWLALDDLLTGPSFPALSKVIFKENDDTSTGFDAQEYMQSKLPKCKKRKFFIAA